MYSQLKLANGIKLLTIPLKNTKAITVLVLLPVGSRYEPKELNGSSHFIEHMMFKGTKRRPSNLAIAKELDGIGAEYNAFTGKDHTGYWIKLVSEKLDIALDVLSDVLFNSLFDEGEFQREKGVILEEIKMYEENPLYHIEDLFEETIYGEHPLGWLISGDIPTIQNLNREKLLTYKEKFYQPNQMLVVLAGDIQNKQAAELIKKYFNYSKTKSSKNKYLKFGEKIEKPKSKIKIFFQDIKQAQIALGAFAYPYNHPLIEALSLLAIILGGNMSSRLFTEIRVKRGLAYFVKMELNPYQDTGYYAIRAGVDQEKITEALSVILDEIKKIREGGVTPEELNRAKDYIEGTLKLSLEDSAALAGWYGKQKLLIGKTLSPQEKLDKIKKVTLSDIQRVANFLFKNQNLNLALIGPFKENKPFLQILSKI